MNNVQRNVSGTPGISNYAKRGYQGAKNTTGRAYNSYQGMSTLGKVLTVILVIAIIIAIAMWIRYAYNITVWKSQDSPYLITHPVNASDSAVSNKAHTIPDPVSLAFSFSCWIYIQDWDYKFGQMKNIFTKGEGDEVAPSLDLFPRTNSLKASIATYNDKNSSIESCNINDIPLAKWCNIIYVLNNRSVDLFIDGRLSKNCVLRGVPRLNKSPLFVGANGGFSGRISKLRYFNRAISPSEVSEIYSEGPLFSRGFLGL